MNETAPTATPRGTETILVVEDAEALSHAQVHPDEIHLLITDVVLTDIRGSEVAKSMLEVRQHAKVIFMSGYTDDAVVRHGVLRGDCNYLQKPFTASRLAAKVRAALDKQK